MKIKFLAKGAAPDFYSISGAVINGIDTSLFTEGSIFIGDAETQSAGVYNIEMIGGEIHAALGQTVKAYQIPGRCSDWWEGDWIDVADYDSDACYVVATDPEVAAMLASGAAEYWRDPADGKWTVRLVEVEQEPTQ